MWSSFDLWAVTVCLAFPSAPGDDAIRGGSLVGLGVAARPGPGGFAVVRLDSVQVAWRPGGLVWFRVFRSSPAGEVPAGGGALALGAAGADLPGVARPGGEPFAQPRDVSRFQRAHGGECDLWRLIQAPGEPREVLAVQRRVQAAGEADQLGRAVVVQQV